MIRCSHLTLVIPYQPGTTSRSGKPCCGGSGSPLHPVREQHVVALGVGERQAALVDLLDAALDAAVEAR